MLDFPTTFKLLTGHPPFPWQEKMYQHFQAGEWDQIKVCTLPTGLGKTSVIAIWLIALANGAAVPRRLVYVVNRRTVVDQTTDEAKKYRDSLKGAGLFEPLRKLTATELKEGDSPLALSTLRGQFADNRDWSADPSRPAVICGTVDMIGSRLLFSGYGLGFKQKPLHAGFLVQDALLIHDEAHLEPAFQKLLEAIVAEQTHGRFPDHWPLKVMELTATSRGQGEPFTLTKADHNNPEVKQRVQARKPFILHAIADDKKTAEGVVELALAHRESGQAVLVFVRTVEDVLRVRDKLAKQQVLTLTGTMRGKERDGLVLDPIFQRFLPESSRINEVVPAEGTAYLICTSAGEVGVNLSADHLICDLSSLDSMAQRFGRVNRFGLCPNTQIVIVFPERFDPKHELTLSRERTLALLPRLEGDASPRSVSRLIQGLSDEERKAAFAPEPIILPPSDILFDAWALTTIKGKLPGRPHVEPFLHGVGGWQPPETQVAWRQEVAELNQKPWTDWGRAEFGQFAAELLEDYPLKPLELLRDNSARVFDRLKKLPAPDETPAWLLSESGDVEPTTLGQIRADDKEALNFVTLILPPQAGGLSQQGMFDGTSEPRPDLDVADELYLDKEKTKRQRLRVWSKNDPRTLGMRIIRRIDFESSEDDADAEAKTWFWFTAPREGGSTAARPVGWQDHVNDVARECDCLLAELPFEKDLKNAIQLAARFHDHGKRRKRFQTVLANLRYPELILAKSGRRGGRVPETYRHEFGSLLDVEADPEFLRLSPELKDVVLHLIAVHHGRGRPHFPADEAFDPERPQADADRLAVEVPRRFARLQRQYGRWGLAYLESLLRAADWAASANPKKFLEEAQP